jgi:HD-GYP domain-containing protein (c-di-GMP phosphodiesterase class II)
MGEAIPLAARITAVCDVFDALRSKRPYKDPWPLAATLVELESQRGRHFDPGVVDAFLELAPTLGPDLLQEDPGVGVLTFAQSTPAGATERIHSRRTSPPTRA